MLRNRQTPPRAQNVSGMLSGRDLGGAFRFAMPLMSNVRKSSGGRLWCAVLGVPRASHA